MIYDKAILFQPLETKGYFYSELKLELMKDGNTVKSFQAKERLFDVNEDRICIYDQAPTGQDSGVIKGNLIFKIPMNEIKEFQRL